MVWGVESGSLHEELLNTYELLCYGGRNEKGEMTYRVFHKTNGFQIYLTEKEISNIGIYYTKYLRENKLERILNDIQ